MKWLRREFKWWINHWGSRLFFVGAALVYGCAHSPLKQSQEVCLAPRVVRVAILDSGANNLHQNKVLEVLQQSLRSSPLEHFKKQVQVSAYPLYDEQGNLTLATFQKSLEQAILQKAEVINFSWNLALNEQTQPLRDLVLSTQKKYPHIFWVAAAGEIEPKPGLILPMPLSQTVLGLDSVYVIGELNEQNLLAPFSAFGSQLFTALRPLNSSYQGSSFTSPIFSAELALNLVCASSAELTRRLAFKKKNRQKLYPELEELF